MKSLGGSGRALLSGGAIGGVNLAAMARNAVGALPAVRLGPDRLCLRKALYGASVGANSLLTPLA